MTEECVRVAVRIRPLLPREVLNHHEVCVRVVPGLAQVMLGSDRQFSFDHVFGPTASQEEVYESCVQPLVESFVRGSNATVFCYGQTGSGKTYTLEGGNQDEGGIKDCVAQDVFMWLQEEKKNTEGLRSKVKVSYLELYREELRDLLELPNIQKELHIREDDRGNTVVVGAKEVVVTSAEELLSVVEMGNALRSTGSTGMNEHSSRAHTILTLHVNICRRGSGGGGSSSSLPGSVQTSKLCLVDLAGSERAGKTGNTGTRLKESAHINTGLLALGNVIRALSEHSRSRRGNSCANVHVPYRDAKITRMLRDSLGGTAHTLMVACVSPSHHYVAETLNVLQFASKARHIRNSPGAGSSQAEGKLGQTTWNPDEARLEELEYEVQTLRELLKEKEKNVEMQKEKTEGRDEETESWSESSQIQRHKWEKLDLREGEQFYLLAQEAEGLLADVASVFGSPLLKHRLKDWQERFKAAIQQCRADEKEAKDKLYEEQIEPPASETVIKLKEEFFKCEEALRLKVELLERKDAELRKLQSEAEELTQEKRVFAAACEEEHQRVRIQAEQLVNQEILICQLRSNLMDLHVTAAGVKVPAIPSQRPHSVPLVAHSSLSRPSRKIHSSPPAYSLERVMAAYKIRGQLLLAEMEEKEEVYSPFLKQQTERTTGHQSKNKEDDIVTSERSRCSLNQTWTSRQKKTALKEMSPRQVQTCYEHGAAAAALLPPTTVTDKEVSQPREKQVRKARKASATERRIRDLSVNMQMKEELIKQLEKTDSETRAVHQHGRRSSNSKEVDVFQRLATQNQQVRSEVYHSLQHMRLQRAQLQSSLRELWRNRGHHSSTRLQSEKKNEDDVMMCQSGQVESCRTLCDTNWLEEEEDVVLKQRAELLELEEELEGREEMLQRREACLQQKRDLESKMLRSSQALSQDLLRVSMRMEYVEEQLQSSDSNRQDEGTTIEELMKEREILRRKKHTLDAQLRNNSVLTLEEQHSLLQLEEAIEAFDAALDFKNQSIQNKQDKLMVSDLLLHQSKSCEVIRAHDVFRKFKKLSAGEATELLVVYFNKVVGLREAERRLHLRCEELQLHAGEQETLLRQMEADMQRLALDADRRLTQQQKDHQSNIQDLLQKLKEDLSGETPHASHDRLQHLEKELFFYKSTSRQLKKRLKELLGETPCSRGDHGETHVPQVHENPVKPTNDFCQTHHALSHATSNSMLKEVPPNRHSHQPHVPSSSPFSDRPTQQKSRAIEHDPIPSTSKTPGAKGQSGESLEMTPVRLCRRELRQICPADLQISAAAASRTNQSVTDSSVDPMLEDSIEMGRQANR